MGLLRRAAGLLGAVAIGTSSACTTGAAPEPEVTSPTLAASAACREAQRVWVWSVQDRLQSMTTAVLSSPGQAKADAAVHLRHLLGRIELRAQRRCGDGRTALVPLIELAYSRDDTTVDEPLLRRMVDELETWASAVGEPSAGRIVYAAHPCELVDDAVEVVYEVHRRPEPGGTAAWVEMRVTNDWTERLMLDHGGALLVDGLAPHGRSRRFDWGGSSADSAMVGPGRTTRFATWPARRPDQYVHLLPGGSARATEVYAGGHTSTLSCGLTVTRSR